MGPKKRKKGVGYPVPDDFSSDTDSFKSGIGMDDEEDDKYSVYKAFNYIRKYPDGNRNTEYIVFFANKENKPFCDKDRILISKALRKHCGSRVKHLKTINKYRVGIIFDISNNANMFVQNKKILDEILLTASIPASAAECTGVLKNVPLSMFNKKIFSVIASTRNVIQVRRIMRRSKEHGLQPTSVVASSYSCAVESIVFKEYIYSRLYCTPVVVICMTTMSSPKSQTSPSASSLPEELSVVQLFDSSEHLVSNSSVCEQVMDSNEPREL
ncbi:hypothetical protein ACJJTC_014241 [Scirpophaga incertulas]